jgi:hypothetical protein
MPTKLLCKGDKIILLKSGINAKERKATVWWANQHDIIAKVSLWIFPIGYVGPLEMSEEGTTWRRPQ